MTTYRNALRSFDHAPLAEANTYHALRQALSDFSNESRMPLGEFLTALRDMALTAPYADGCRAGCMHMTWPHAVERKGDGLQCHYRCPKCSTEWTCGYRVTWPEFAAGLAAS